VLIVGISIDIIYQAAEGSAFSVLRNPADETNHTRDFAGIIRFCDIKNRR
jgi:hypothetical protein